MNQTAVTARALSALGHEARLRVYRLLVRAGEDGLIIGDIASHTGLPLSTLAHHLRQLISAGLIVQEKRGREVVNRADYVVLQKQGIGMTVALEASIDRRHGPSGRYMKLWCQRFRAKWQLRLGKLPTGICIPEGELKQKAWVCKAKPHGHVHF